MLILGKCAAKHNVFCNTPVLALDEQVFYNTGIAIYVWILCNHKPPERKEKVQMISATDYWFPMHKRFGDKRREISADQIQQISEIYINFQESDVSKIFNTTDFGYRKITVNNLHV